MRILSVFNAGADTDKFLVQDGTGAVKFRTGAEVASDIGAAVGYVDKVKHEVKLGEAIAKGQAVYVTSADGTNMIVSKASNASEATSSKTLGLLETGGTTNDKVFVITEGLLSGLNTSTATIGDPVWLGVNGDLIYGLVNKPYAPAHLVFIGIVTRVNTNNGEIFIKVQNGFELKEIHDVQITGTPVDKAVIQYDTASGLWKNSTLGGVTASTGTAGQVAYFTGATTQAGSNNLFWDNTNGRLGIGTNAPAVKLEVVGRIDNYNGFILNRSDNFGVFTGASDDLGIYHNGTNSFISNSTGALIFNNPSERMRLHATGNLHLGGTSDAGQRLQVTGDTLLKGSGNTSATVALTVQNSDGSDMLRVRSDQKLLIGAASTTAAPAIYAFSGITGARSLRIGIQSANSLTPTPAFNINQENDYTYTSGTGEFTTITANFLPTSGTGTLASLVLRNTINQTGGANGITRGLYVNPTLTAAADWRSIEWSNNSGWGLYGVGTSLNYLNGNLLLGSTTNSGQRLQVTGDTLLKGSGNTSATTALTVQDSIGNALFSVRNDNVINIGLRPAVSIYPAAFGAVQNITGRGIAMSFIASDTAYEPLTLTHGNLTSTANGYIVFNTIGTFNPTSGTATYTANRIGSTINQTGGANGITRGLYVNPTLTAAADWRSIEWSNNTGWGLYGAGTSNNFLNGNLGIGTTTPSRKQEIFTATSGSTVSLLKLKNQGAGDSGAAIDFDFFATDGVGARIAGIRTGAASFQSALVFYTNQGSTNVNIAESARFTYLQNFLIGSTTDSGEKLQVNGTAKITGATSFGGNMSLTLNQNASTKINVTNTTSDTNAYSTFIATSNGSGLVEFGKYSQLKTTYKILASGDGFIYNGVYGDISILNDNATGSIKFAAGGSSTAQMTLTSVGSLGIGATSVNASAITQIDSTTKGFLPPRMTTVQKLAIATPAAGLMVYDTTLNQMSYYNATIWINF